MISSAASRCKTDVVAGVCFQCGILSKAFFHRFPRSSVYSSVRTLFSGDYS